jgi:DNA-binding beta-propeller fold protein YncE
MTSGRARLIQLQIGLCLICHALSCGIDDRSERGAHIVLVSQAGSTTIAAIDPDQGTVLKRIQVGELPHRLLRSRDGSRVFAVLVGSQAVAELDPRALELRRTFLTAPVPELRADGSVIDEHATQRASEHTTCFDCHRPGGAKPPVVGERPVGIALSEDETRLYVSHIRGARLSVIDLQTGAIERSESLPPAQTAIEAADLVHLPGSLAVSLRPVQPSTDPGAVRFLDEQSFEVRAEFATGSDPAALLALPERGSVLVSHFDSNSVSELAPARDPRRFVVTPGPLGSLALADPPRVLTLDYYSNAASLLDLDSGSVTELELELNGESYVNPTHAALSPQGDVAYIVSSGTDGHLLVLDLKTRSLVSAIAIDGLSFDLVVIPR